MTFQKIIASKFVRCLLAGAWFAIAAIIPVVYYFLQFGDHIQLFGGSSFFTAALPIIMAAVCGFLLGSNILDADEIKSEWQAAGRGMLTAVISYILLFIITVALTALTSGAIIDALILYVFIFLYGLIFVGWLIAIVGAVSGWLLYLFRLKFIERHN